MCNVDIFGYADDVMVLKAGCDLLFVQEQVQLALDKLEDWAGENNLKFNVDKTKAILFTRKFKFTEPTITLNGKNIEFVNSFKYLGVIFDKKLNWNEHVKAQAKKAKAALMIGRRMVGNSWGLNPKTTHWLYTAIVRPILTYGCVIWTTSLEK